MASTAATFELPSPRDIVATWWGQREEIGDAYLEMVYRLHRPNMEERRAWALLARETTQHALAVSRLQPHGFGLWNIDEVDDPEPYATAREMVASMNTTGIMKVSTANTEHPLWTPRENTDFRIVHDGMGHYLSGGAFSWQGELDACGIHFRMVKDPLARRALFTECIGQVAAFYNLDKQHAPQVCGFLPEEFTKGILHA